MAVVSRAAVLTVSDGVSVGKREDLSGPAVVGMLRERLGIDDITTHVTPDERMTIQDLLSRWADLDGFDLIITSGGTGISPRDVTPDATLAVLDYQIPGFGELMRAASLKKTPMAALSRAVAGVRGAALIINLPGSPKGARECLEALLPVLPHALEQLAGQVGHE